MRLHELAEALDLRELTPSVDDDGRSRTATCRIC